LKRKRERTIRGFSGSVQVLFVWLMREEGLTPTGRGGGGQEATWGYRSMYEEMTSRYKYWRGNGLSLSITDCHQKEQSGT
jgi:hypothetical protein